MAIAPRLGGVDRYRVLRQEAEVRGPGLYVYDDFVVTGTPAVVQSYMDFGTFDEALRPIVDGRQPALRYAVDVDRRNPIVRIKIHVQNERTRIYRGSEVEGVTEVGVDVIAYLMAIDVVGDPVGVGEGARHPRWAMENECRDPGGGGDAGGAGGIAQANLPVSIGPTGQETAHAVVGRIHQGRVGGGAENRIPVVGVAGATLAR